MFFLTTLAGIDPAVAGVLTAVGAIWNGLCERNGILTDGAWLFDCKDYEKRVTSRRG